MDLSKFFNLEGKVAVITGGAGILCSEMARAIGERGGKVVILDISEESMYKLSKELNTKEIENLTIKTNILDKDNLKEAADKTMKEFGQVDILINGAGGNKAETTTGPDKSFFDLPEDAVKWVFNLNFLGTFLTTQVFGKLIADKGEGVIINISSMAAYAALTKVPVYSAAKAAISNFTQWLAVHISKNYSDKIRVNAIAPGFFLTEQNRYLLMNKDNKTLTERGKTIIEHTPMKRFGDPTDLVSTILWLASPGAEFVHGIVIPVDGGFSAFGGV
ncbi:MAG: SDR family oxidoreductase [candidate division WOR-3 bacterium]|jgi:NAD(P)-dependent dehydrogenase (short-subunit alcohol dehydrogenase family)